jgi:hypothetical protein
MPKGRRVLDYPKVEAKILEAIRAGNTRRAAAAYAGVDEETLARWLRDTRKMAFMDSFKKAEADAEVLHVASIAQASKDGSWQASAWWLERRRHQDWRKREEIKLTGSEEEPVVIKAITNYRRAVEALAPPDEEEQT